MVSSTLCEASSHRRVMTVTEPLHHHRSSCCEYTVVRCVCTFAQLPARFQYNLCQALIAVNMIKNVLPDDRLTALLPAQYFVAKQGGQTSFGNFKTLCILGEASSALLSKPLHTYSYPTSLVSSSWSVQVQTAQLH